MGTEAAAAQLFDDEDDRETLHRLVDAMSVSQRRKMRATALRLVSETQPNVAQEQESVSAVRQLSITGIIKAGSTYASDTEEILQEELGKKHDRG